METIYIGCVSTIFFGTILTIVLAFFALLRYMRYKETLVLAEKGLLRGELDHNGKGTLRWGIVVAGLGFALCLGLYPLGWTIGGSDFPLNFGPWMLFGLVPSFFGLSLVLIYFLTNRADKPEPPILPDALHPAIDETESELL
jgi:Flp pilus assembly protein protease CpaA